MSLSYLPVYHYTDKAAGKRIMSSGKIRRSTDTVLDTAYGEGTYFTSLAPPPENSLDDILLNNWETTNPGKDIDAAIKVEIEKGRVKKRSRGRNIYVCEGDAVQGKNGVGQFELILF